MGGARSKKSEFNLLIFQRSVFAFGAGNLVVKTNETIQYLLIYLLSVLWYENYCIFVLIGKNPERTGVR
jgi:hypothetical protein